MQTVDTDIVLDVYNVDAEPPIVKAARDDHNLRYIHVYLTNNGNNYTILGTPTILLFGVKPGDVMAFGTGWNYTIDEDTENSLGERIGIEAVITSEFTDTVGDVVCQFRLVDDASDPEGPENSLRTQKFIIRVIDNIDHEYANVAPLD